jgi:hypothetical protein
MWAQTIVMISNRTNTVKTQYGTHGVLNNDEPSLHRSSFPCTYPACDSIQVTKRTKSRATSRYIRALRWIFATWLCNKMASYSFNYSNSTIKYGGHKTWSSNYLRSGQELVTIPTTNCELTATLIRTERIAMMADTFPTQTGQNGGLNTGNNCYAWTSKHAYTNEIISIYMHADMQRSRSSISWKNQEHLVPCFLRAPWHERNRPSHIIGIHARVDNFMS